MKIAEIGNGQRRKWRDIVLGMSIMIGLFMLADGISKIRHGRDFGWLVASAGAISLLMSTFRAMKKD
jgi:hypothetical protein